VIQGRCPPDRDPRYPGHKVWNCQRADEVLIDVEDVALGHTVKMRWNAADQWVRSERVAHRRSSAKKTSI
jgi:hypothetical protein